jgi:hypothetical protein
MSVIFLGDQFLEGRFGGTLAPMCVAEGPGMRDRRESREEDVR